MRLLLTIFLPWVRIAELKAEAAWLLEGWNRTCVINDGIRDALERAGDRNHDYIRDLLSASQRNRELAEEVAELRQRAA